MATEETIKPLIDALNEVLSFRNKDLTKRKDWGSITFDAAADDLDRIFTAASYLHELPVKILTDQTINQISSQLTDVTRQLEAIDAFNVEQANPPQVRDGLIQSIHQQADQFYTVATPWIPFLAYQKGDVSNNIEALNTAVDDANAIVSAAKTSIEEKQSEIDTIITRAREASAAAGAAVFTKDFSEDAAELETTATKWLWVTGGLAISTSLLAGAMWYFVEPDLSKGQLIQKFGSKMVILAVFFTTTIWCGRVYRALKHQATVNRHRALSLQTLQAFSSAASDLQTKDAVLLEATRAIFGSSTTGYLDGKGDHADNNTRIVEIARTPAVVQAAEKAARGSST